MADYSTLVSAIADVGYWRWWTERLPGLFQLEFGGVQIYSPPATEAVAPSSLLALRFLNPSRISFLTRAAGDSPSPEWPHLLQSDQINPPSVSHDQFALNDDRLFDEVLSQVQNEVLHFSSDLGGTEVRLAFWAGEVGIRIEAAELRPVLMSGEVDLATIVSMHGDWWSYWKEYWAKRGTSKALPSDYACEVTIPTQPE